jgi:hypothetical protein
LGVLYLKNPFLTSEKWILKAQFLKNWKKMPFSRINIPKNTHAIPV